MKLTRSIAALAAFWSLVLLCAGPAAANLRAPMRHHSPSTAPGAPGAELSVLQEQLDFSCQKQGCLVRARYYLRAVTPGSWRLAFVLPQAAKVTVRANGTTIQADSRPVQWSDPNPRTLRRDKLPLIHILPPMHEAAFDLSLPQGQSVVEVSYRQAWGKAERKFQGYFSGWLSALTLRYELWPLSQWRLAPGFVLRVGVRVSGDAASAVLLRAAADPGEISRNLKTLRPDGEGTLAGTLAWGASFPARLELVAGSDKALATYGVRPPQNRPGHGQEKAPGDP